MGIELLSLTICICVTVISALLATAVYETVSKRDSHVSRTGLAEQVRQARQRHNSRESHAGRPSLDRKLETLVSDSRISESALSFVMLATFISLLAGGVTLVLTLDGLIAGFAATLSAAGVVLIAVYLRNRRRTAIRELFPDYMEMLARSVKSGNSLEQSLRHASRNGRDTLNTEFFRCTRELEAGRAATQVFESLWRRYRLRELRLLAMTVSIQRAAGGHLPDSLMRLARVSRDQRAIERNLQSTTAGGRASALLCLVLFPIAFGAVYVLSPNQFSQFVSDPLGQVLILLAFGLEIVGAVWVFRLLQPKRL